MSDSTPPSGERNPRNTSKKWGRGIIHPTVNEAPNKLRNPKTPPGKGDRGKCAHPYNREQTRSPLNENMSPLTRNHNQKSPMNTHPRHSHNNHPRLHHTPPEKDQGPIRRGEMERPREQSNPGDTPEECLGVPMRGSTWGLLIGTMVVIWGV